MNFKKIAEEKAGHIYRHDSTQVAVFQPSGVRYIDELFETGPLTGWVRFIQQNETKDSLYAKLAQRGHEIVWICSLLEDRKIKYTAWGVVDGKFTENIYDTCAALALKEGVSI